MPIITDKSAASSVCIVSKNIITNIINNATTNPMYWIACVVGLALIVFGIIMMYNQYNYNIMFDSDKYKKLKCN